MSNSDNVYNIFTSVMADDKQTLKLVRSSYSYTNSLPQLSRDYIGSVTIENGNKYTNMSTQLEVIIPISSNLITKKNSFEFEEWFSFRNTY